MGVATTIRTARFCIAVAVTGPAVAVSPTDFSRPLETGPGALVCSFAAAMDPREGKGIDAAMKSRMSTFGRKKEAEAAGCEEWREGVPVQIAPKGIQRARDFQSRQKCGMVEGAGQLFFSCDLRNAP